MTSWIDTKSPGALVAFVTGAGSGIGAATARELDSRGYRVVAAALVARQPLGRLGRTDEIATAIAYLAGDEAAFVTGSALVIDGGLTAQ